MNSSSLMILVFSIAVGIGGASLAYGGAALANGGAASGQNGAASPNGAAAAQAGAAQTANGSGPASPNGSKGSYRELKAECLKENPSLKGPNLRKCIRAKRQGAASAS